VSEHHEADFAVAVEADQSVLRTAELVLRRRGAALVGADGRDLQFDPLPVLIVEFAQGDLDLLATGSGGAHRVVVQLDAFGRDLLCSGLRRAGGEERKRKEIGEFHR